MYDLQEYGGQKRDNRPSFSPPLFILAGEELPTGSKKNMGRGESEDRNGEEDILAIGEEIRDQIPRLDLPVEIYAAMGICRAGHQGSQQYERQMVETEQPDDDATGQIQLIEDVSCLFIS